MRRPCLTVVLAAAFLALCACSRAGGQAASSDSPGFRKQVLAYLADHPEVIEEAAADYQQKQHDQRVAEAAKAIAARRAALEHDPRDFVANPNGKITVVEFFDYRCPYCKAALPRLMALIDGNKDVRFVFKEFPILPDADGRIGVSLRASEAAIVAGRQGKYVQVHNDMMAMKPLDDAGIAKALHDNGVDPDKTPLGPEVNQHIKDVRELASAIGASGTPTFVVGDRLIEGNRMDELAAAIANARIGAKG